ncbi:MAG TPA: CAP domain-containing protein, partial [Euzebya sp.]|nr:CAP domain-containing protein [Euzebya sp.]
RLATLAASWSARMAGGAGLSHNPDHRGEYGWPTAGAGEIVAYSRDASASADQLATTIVDGWMGSSGHRACVLDDGWTDMGVGCAWGADGRLYATVNMIRTELPAAAAEALALSTELIAGAGAPRMAITRCDLAADALAASALLGGQSPLLLARPGQALPPSVVAEISRAATPPDPGIPDRRGPQHGRGRPGTSNRCDPGPPRRRLAL